MAKRNEFVEMLEWIQKCNFSPHLTVLGGTDWSSSISKYFKPKKAFYTSKELYELWLQTK